MNILIVYRHFWPDSPPYASMLRTLGRTLSQSGHKVTIWTGQPCYKSADRQARAPRCEELDGVVVERLRPLPGARRFAFIHLVDKLVFPLLTVAKALRRRLMGERYDVVWTATIPPIVAGLSGRTIAALLRSKFLYHCQDLYPELAGHAGLWSRRGAVYRIAEAIERRTRRRADLLVTLSNDMANTVRAVAEPRRLAVINNFPLECFNRAGVERPLGAQSDIGSMRSNGRIRMIFAGNLGRFQGLEATIDAMRLIEKERSDLELVFLGEGKALPDLRERAANLRNVHFEPHRSFEEAQRIIADADIGLVSLQPGIYRYAFPSKTLTYLDLGLCLFVIAEEDSELAKFVKVHRLGGVSFVNNAHEIAEQLKVLVEKADVRTLRVEAKRTFQSLMGREVVLSAWQYELAALAESGA